MKNHRHLTTLLIAMALGTAGVASAQVAGSATTIGITIATNTQVAVGWSVKKGIMGKTVYNDAGAIVGKVDDLIIDPDKNVSYLIVAAGGFVGIGRHPVAFAIDQVKQQDGRIVVAGATKDVVRAMPEFHYATDSSEREQFVMRADRDIAAARTGVDGLQQRASTAMGDSKVKMDQDVAEVRGDIKVAEDKLAGLKSASATRWKDFESDVSEATARLRKSLDKATS